MWGRSPGSDRRYPISNGITIRCLPNDASVTITTRGDEKGRAAWVESKKIKDRVFADISPEDRVQMIDLLRRLSGELSQF